MKTSKVVRLPRRDASALPGNIADRLIEEARAIRRNAHAPYSHFNVGVAVLGSSGRVHLGVNVENASYGLSVCAERHAIAAAVAAGEKSIRAVAVATHTSPPTPPCGACRQVIREFATPDCVVILASERGAAETHRFADLLPRSFGPEYL